MTSILLVDNGSLQPAATRQLRRIAAALGRKLRRKVEPVSLLHSNKVPAKKLGGHKAEILNHAVLHRLHRGARDFVIVPLFIGRSRALTKFIPDLVKQWRKHCPTLRVRLAAPLAATGDDRLARFLEAQVRAKFTPSFLRGQRARIALVDHGSPVKSVTQVRNRLAADLRRRLGAKVAGVAPCSMEIPRSVAPLNPPRSPISDLRSPRRQATLCEPLLEALLAKPPWNTGPVIIAQLFLLPGRHAGPRGDIAAICARATKYSPRLRTRRTRLLGEHAGLIGILASRCRAAKIGVRSS